MARLENDEKGSSLVRPVTLVICSGAVTFAFLGLLPTEQQLRAMAQNAESGTLSAVYLRLLIRFNPGDVELRRAFARALSTSGKYDEARAILESMVQFDGPDGREAMLAILMVDYAEANTLTNGDPRRDYLISRIGLQLEALRNQPIEPERLSELAELSLGAKRQDLAVVFFEKAIFAARQNEANIHDRADRAFNALLAHGAGREAVELAEALIGWSKDDRAFLLRGVDVALSQNDHDQAQAWGRRLVALFPQDSAILSKQLDLELATSNLEAAVQLARKLVALDPSNPERRTQLARIAQWDGQRELALEQWSWLARQNPTSEAMASALALAQALNAHERWVELAARLTQARALEPRELETLVYLHATRRTPAELVVFLEQYLRRHPKHREAWQALAETHEKQGNFAAAASIWQRMTPALVPPVESAIRQASLLRRGDRTMDGLSCLRAVRRQATRSDVAYWRLYGDLAWEQSYKSEAFDAYRIVWDAGEGDGLVAERLIQSYRERGEPMLAIGTARRAYSQRGEERWLLLAMDAAAQALLWTELKSLSETARREEHRFAQSEMYWLLQAQLALHERSNEDAQRAYDAALEINPASAPARVGTLWLETELGDKKRLAKHLDQWREDASTNPPYWAPFAAGLLRLGRTSESLPWFAKQADHAPHDLMWLMSYADALARAGRPTEAWRIRRHVHAALMRRREDEDGDGKPVNESLLLTHADLAQEFEGTQFGEQVRRDVLQRGGDDAVVRERAIASYLGKNDYEGARRWMSGAGAARRKLPAWQQLAVALAQDDKNAVSQLLVEQGDELSAEDRITALRRLGRDDEAFVLAQRTVVEREGPAAEGLQQHIDQLAAERASTIVVHHDLRRLGELEISRTQLTGSVVLNGGRIAAQVASNQLRPKGAGQSDVGDEHDVSVQYEHPVGGGRMRLTLGTNQRRDESASYGRYEWNWPMWTDTTARLDLTINGVTDDSAALRTIGTRDKLATGIAVRLSDTEFVQAEVAAQRFHTRDGHTLGEGYRVDAEAGSTLSAESLRWQVRLQGSFQRNAVRDTLPEGLATSMLSPSTNVQSIVADRYATIGAGTTVRIGAGQESSRQAFAEFDAWLGRVWPDDNTAYQLRVSAGVPVGAAGTLTVEGFYTNLQGGQANEAYRGVGFFYSHRF